MNVIVLELINKSKKSIAFHYYLYFEMRDLDMYILNGYFSYDFIDKFAKIGRDLKC